MAAQARTLLAKLGFADADRKNPRHDRVCNYLCLRPEALSKTIAAATRFPVRVSAEGVPEYQVLKGEGKYATTVGFVDVFARFEARAEKKIRVPVGRITHGLAPLSEQLAAATKAHPVFYRFLCADGQVRPSPEWEKEYRDWECKTSLDILRRLGEADAALRPAREALRSKAPLCSMFAFKKSHAIIEVKIGFVSSGDLIRQMRVYREFVQPSQYGCRSAVPDEWLGADDDDPEFARRESEEFSKVVDRELDIPSIAVVDYEVDQEYVSACKLAGISVVRLGAGFEAFLKENRESGKVSEL